MSNDNPIPFPIKAWSTHSFVKRHRFTSTMALVFGTLLLSNVIGFFLLSFFDKPEYASGFDGLASSVQVIGIVIFIYVLTFFFNFGKWYSLEKEKVLWFKIFFFLIGLFPIYGWAMLVGYLLPKQTP